MREEGVRFLRGEVVRDRGVRGVEGLVIFEGEMCLVGEADVRAGIGDTSLAVRALRSGDGLTGLLFVGDSLGCGSGDGGSS